MAKCVGLLGDRSALRLVRDDERFIEPLAGDDEPSEIITYLNFR